MSNWRRLLTAVMRRTWPLLGLVVLTLAAWAEPLLIQRAYPRTIEIGGHDLGLAEGWSAKEIAETLPGPRGPVAAVYRWSGASSSLVFAPAVMRQPYIVSLALLSGRPGPGALAPVRLFAADQPLAELAVGPTVRSYHVLVPGALANAEALTLRIEAPTFSTEDDGRVLGLIGLEARAEPAGSAPWLPHPALPLFLLAFFALLLANGLPAARALAVALIALALLLLAGFVAPAETLAAARTLAWLFAIAALVVGAVRWLRRGAAGTARLPRSLSFSLRRHPWQWAAVALLLLTCLLFTPSLSADGVEYYAYVRSIAQDGDIEFTNELKGEDVPFKRVPDWLASNRSPTGYAQNLASVGPAIVWAPFYMVGSLIVRGGNALGANWSTDGYSLPYIALVNLASVVSLPITVWLCYLAARRVASHSIALLAAVSLVGGSAILDYGLFEARYPHALAAMTVAAFFCYWLYTRPERTFGQWIVLGLLAGAMALMYWINAILLLLPALDMLPPFLRALRARDARAIGVMLVGGLIFLAALLAAFSPQMIAWVILYGSPFTVPHGSSFAEPHGFKALQMLFSPVHGQLLWAPITMVALLGMGWYIARRRWEGSLVLLAFSVYFLYNATLGSWHGGGPFGLRRITNVVPLLAPGLACLLAWLGRLATNDERRTTNQEQVALATHPPSPIPHPPSPIPHPPSWPLTLCVLCLAWNAGLLLRYLAYLIPHHPSELGTLTIGEFVLAPNNLPWYKLPAIVGEALFPRLLVQGASNPAGGQWGPFVLLIGATAAIVVGAVALVAWLQRRIKTSEPGGRSQSPRPQSVPSAQGI
jgi:hypothetical protein